MAKPLENPGSVALRAGAEANVVRSEPVVEFARKKSPVPATDSLGDSQPSNGHSGAEREGTPFCLADLPRIPLPRDASRPIVTANQRYAIAALESYKGLRTRLMKFQASRGCHSIAITSVGRAQGKTLTAFNLACCCAQVENQSVLLIDGDLRSRSLTKLVGGLPAVGLADVMSGKASSQDAIVRTDLRNLYVMGAGTSAGSSMELFSTGRWGELVRWSSTLRSTQPLYARSSMRSSPSSSQPGEGLSRCTRRDS